jgi:hypothetical protein
MRKKYNCALTSQRFTLHLGGRIELTTDLSTDLYLRRRKGALALSTIGQKRRFLIKRGLLLGISRSLLRIRNGSNTGFFRIRHLGQLSGRFHADLFFDRETKISALRLYYYTEEMVPKISVSPQYTYP